MFGLIATSLLFGYFVKKEWDKTKDVDFSDLVNNESPEYLSTAVVAEKNVDLISFLKAINDYSCVIKESIDTEDWFKCTEQQKLSVVKTEKGVSVCLHLPDYTKRSCKPKISDYMRCVCEWRKSLKYRSDLTTELHATHLDSEGDTVVTVIPEDVTEEFGDDRDPRGVNRMFEALVLNRNENHEKAIKAYEDFLGTKIDNENMYQDVVIKINFKNIDNKDLEEILSTPLVITRDGEELETQNILFCPELGTFYDFNDEGQVTEYVKTGI